MIEKRKNLRNGQPVPKDDRRIFVALTSKQEQRSLVRLTFAFTAELQPESYLLYYLVI